MALNLGVKLSLDKGNLPAGAREAANAVDQIAEAAKRTEAASVGAADALDKLGVSAGGAGGALGDAGDGADHQKRKTDEATESTKRHGTALRSTGAQAQQLSYQLNDVFTSLASGINPMMVAIQQGGQITQIYGGLGGTMSAAFGWLTPARLGLGVVGGLFAIGAKAALGYAAATREADVAARGVGRTAGTSAGEIELIARRYAQVGDIAADQARSIAVELTRTGRIGTEQFGGLITIAKDFGATVGTDVEGAGKQLADLFADPAKGAETLSKSLNLIDESAARAVQKLAEVGETSKAQTALFQALDGRLVKYKDSVPFYTKWWDDLWHPKTPGGDLGAALSERSPQEQLERLQRQYLSAKKAISTREKVGFGDVSGLDDAWLAKTEAEIERLERLVERADRAAAGRAASARLDRSGSMAVGLADRSPATEELTRRAALEKELAGLERGSKAPNLTAEERQKIALAIDADTRALSTWISETERAQALDRIDLQLLATRDPAQRAELERERVKIQLRGQAIGSADASAAAERAYARSIGEVSAQAQGSISDLLADAAARQRVNDLVAAGSLSSADAARELQIEAATRQLVALAAQKQSEEQAHLLGLADQLRAATVAQAEEDKRAQAQQAIATGRDRLETLRAEIGLVGQSDAVRTRALATIQAEQEIRRRGLKDTSAEAEQIRANAAAEAELTIQREGALRAREAQLRAETDRIELAQTATRDPNQRANLEAQRARLEALAQGRSAAEAAAAAERAYARSIGEVSAQAQGSISDLLADAAARQRVNDLVAAGALSSADAARELQIEAATRQLVALAAQKQGEEQARLLGLAQRMREAITAQAEADKRAQALQSIATGRDRIETLRAEIGLVGQSEAVRSRTLALLQAEQEIRRQNLDTSSREAQQLRAQALAEADLATQLQRQKDAWDEIKSTGGGAIDTLVNGLAEMRSGADIAKSITKDLLKELLKLSIGNPLKNALFGQNLPEIGDAGGLLGAIGGGKKAAVPSLLPQSIASAQITAGTVIVNGGIAGVGSGTNGFGSTSGASGLPAANDNGSGRVGGGWSLFSPTQATSSSTAPGPFSGPEPSWWRPDLAPSSARIGGTWDRWPSFGQSPIASRATGYSPQRFGDRIEGGYESSIRGPDGQAMVRTLDDYRLGRSDYVTLAGNPAYYGNRYSMPEVSYMSGGQRHTLQNVPGVVHDTGSAFRTAPEGRFDVALGKDLSFAERNQSMSSVQFVSQSQRASAAIDKLATSSTDASSQVTSFGKGLGDLAGSVKPDTGAGGIAAAGAGGGGGLLSGLADLFKGMFGAIFKGFGSIFSGLFGGLFANGSAFSGGDVVSTPTLIGMSGGRRGVIGEKTEEAVMPLARHADGRLGVIAQMPATPAMRLVVEDAPAQSRRAAMPTSAIGPTDAGRIAAAAAAGASRPAAPRVEVPITINNHSSSDVSVQSRSRAGGGREYEIMVRNLKEDMETTYGLRPTMKKRG